MDQVYKQDFTEWNHKWPIIIKMFSIPSNQKMHIKTIRMMEFIDEQTVKMKNNENIKSYLGIGNQAFPHDAGKCVN